MSQDFTVGETLYFLFTTRIFTTGVPGTLAGTPVVSAYEDNSITQITAGITLGVDHDGVTGLNLLTVVATGANGFEAGKQYALVITTGTVSSVSVVGEVVASFSLGAEAAFTRLGAPAGASVSADVLAVKNETVLIVGDTNELQTDWINGGRLDLLLDAIPTTVMRGTDGSFLAANAPTNFSDLSISLTTGLVNITQTAADKVWSSTTRTLTAISTALALSVWKVLETAIVTAGSIGLKVKNNLDAVLTARTIPSASYFDPAADAVANVTLVDTTTVNTDMVVAAPTAQAITNAVWDELQSAHVAVGSFGEVATEIAAIPTTTMRGTDGANTTTPPTVGAIAVQVWDEAQASHVAAGSFGIIATEIAAIPTTAMRGTDGSFLAANAPTNFSDLSITLTTGLVTLAGVTHAGAVIPTVSTLTGHAPQTGDNFARIGAAGASLIDLGGMSTGMKAEVNAEVDGALDTAIPVATTGSINERIKALDDNYTVGRAANLDNLDIAVATRSSHSAANVWTSGTRSLTDKIGFSLSVAGIQAIWDALTSALITAGSIGKLLVNNINATITSRQPSGNVTVGTNNDKTGYQLSAPGVAAILDEVYEGTTTFRQFLRLAASTLFGKLSGAATASITIRDEADSKNRITATVDVDGNRSAVILDKTL